MGLGVDRSFDGIRALYGVDGFNKIQEAHILVVGIGGVGSWACEALIRSSVQKITIVDLDEICISNINRQVHALIHNIGKMKVTQMKERLLQISPEAQINAVEDFLTVKNVDEILSLDQFDYVIDAIDGPKNKCVLVHACVQKEIPVITVGGAGGLVDPTKVEVRDLNRTINDKLMLRMRRTLKKYFPHFKKLGKKAYNVPTVFSTEFTEYSTSIEKPEFVQEIRNCETGYGSASFVTATFGFTACSYVLNSIAGKEQ